MSKDTRNLDNFKNYFQNSIAQAATMGAFNFAISPINELTQINNQSMEIDISLNEKRETIKDMNELQDDED